MSSENFDVVVIGSGPGGYVAAIRAAQLGMKTACIEKYPTRGGTCLNVGCIPSKALLESSEHFSATQHSLSDHGVNVSGVSLDLDKMLKRKDTIVRQLTQGIDYLLKKNKITSITGMGKITNADGDLKTVEVTTAEGVQTIQTKKIIIATGSKPVELPFLPFDKETVVSSTGALQFPRVPQHLVVIGGGVIGLELGSVWHRLGAKVTIVEFSDHICGGMDQETSKELKKVLEKQGMNFLLSHECKGSQKSGDIHLVEVLNRETQETSQLECDFILVSTGRKPYTEGLGLDEVGIQKDNRGRVVINDHFETNIQGVYAIGDVVSGPMLAHKAEEEGVAVAEYLAGLPCHVNYSAIPGIVYTWPELSGVGMTEEEAKAAGIEIKIGKFPFNINGRAKAMGETNGFAKVIADARTDKLLGVHIIGPRAGDIIAEAVTLIEFGGSAEDLGRICHAHPTVSEVLKEAALGVDKNQIHL